MYNPPRNFRGGPRPQDVPDYVPPSRFASESAPNVNYVDYADVTRARRNVICFQPTAAIFNVPITANTQGQLPQAFGSHTYTQHTVSKHNEAAAHMPQQYTTTTQLSFGGYALDK